MAKEDFVYFWDGIFSQWHLSKFEVEGVTYNCAEQFMMHQKALFFKDLPTANKILKEVSPREQKKLGRQVKNFCPKKWDKKSQKVVKEGSIAKFSQNLGLLEALKETKNKELVEASPYDKIWGIGLRASDPLAWNKKTWEGRNLLGKILTEVREEFS